MTAYPLDPQSSRPELPGPGGLGPRARAAQCPSRRCRRDGSQQARPCPAGGMGTVETMGLPHPAAPSSGWRHRQASSASAGSTSAIACAGGLARVGSRGVRPPAQASSRRSPCRLAGRRGRNGAPQGRRRRRGSDSDGRETTYGRAGTTGWPARVTRARVPGGPQPSARDPTGAGRGPADEQGRGPGPSRRGGHTAGRAGRRGDGKRRRPRPSE